MKSTVETLNADQMLAALIEANIGKLREAAQRNGVRLGDALIVRFTDESHIVRCVSQEDGAKLAQLGGAEIIYGYTFVCVMAELTGGAVPCLCTYVDKKRGRYATGCVALPVAL